MSALLEKIEVELAHSVPFGDASYINERVLLHYCARLKKLSTHLVSAKLLENALAATSLRGRRSVLADPVLRDAINASVGHHLLGTPSLGDWASAALDVASRNISGDDGTPPLAMAGNHAQVACGKLAMWVWNAQSAENLLDQRFLELTRKQFNVHLSGNDHRIEAALFSAFEILEIICPRLASSALAHSSWIAFVESPNSFSSATTRSIEATIYVTAERLSSPLELAEAIFHEALHQKFMDLVQTHTILRDDYAGIARVENPWNTGSSHYTSWDIDRCLTVSHVYLCLGLFYARIATLAQRLAKKFGPIAGDLRGNFRCALDRTRYIQSQIARHTDELGLAGLAFVKWMKSVTAQLDPHPLAIEDSVFVHTGERAARIRFSNVPTPA